MYFNLTILVAGSLALLGAASPADGEQIIIQTSGVRVGKSWSYIDCGSEDSTVQLKSITLQPDTPVPGQELTITVKADMLETIQDGATVDVLVKAGPIKILQRTYDICEEARNVNATVQCPVEKGEHTIVQTVQLPREIPRVTYKVDVVAFTHEDNDMACVELEVDFRRKL